MSDIAANITNRKQWLATFTGGKFFPLDPGREVPNIWDIAHGLACENRFAGQCKIPYSVAQHSIMVSDIVMRTRADLALEALMHDASEALLKDLPFAMKRAIPEYKMRFEEPLEQVLAKTFQLQYPWDPVIKRADEIALMTEKRDLFHYASRDWKQTAEPEKGRIAVLGWKDAEAQFLRRFHELYEPRRIKQ